MDNPWGCGTSTGDGKKLCLCLFCIKAAESGWTAGKNLGPPRRTGPPKCRNAAAPCRQGGGAGHGASRRPRPTGIPAHGTGRPSVPPLQKCRDLSDERRRGRSQTGPRAFARGARIQDVSLIRPFGAPYPFCPSGTFPPDRGNRPSPWKREGLRAAKGRPYGGKRPGSVGSAKPGAVLEPQQF